jgi:hypothetical protein
VMKDISTVLEFFPGVDVVGDDWDYPDVQRAVKECARKYELEIHVSGYKCWTYSKQRCDEASRENRKRDYEEAEVRGESQAKKRAIGKMSLKDLMGHYKKKK